MYMCIQRRVCVCVCACVCVRERAWERLCVCLCHSVCAICVQRKGVRVCSICVGCVCVWHRMCVYHVCVCLMEGCTYVRERECMCMYLCVWFYLRKLGDDLDQAGWDERRYSFKTVTWWKALFASWDEDRIVRKEVQPFISSMVWIETPVMNS